MIEQIPLVLKLDNRMVGSPANDRSKNCSFEYKWSLWVFAYRIDDFMSCSRRIGEIVESIIFMNPWTFKISSVLVTRKNWMAVFIYNRDFLRFTFKCQHIIA